MLLVKNLEKSFDSNVIFKNYNESSGSFFTYLYCYIKSTVLFLIKRFDISSYHDYFDFFDCFDFFLLLLYVVIYILYYLQPFACRHAAQ